MKKSSLILMSFVPFMFSFAADYFLAIPGIRVVFLFLMPPALAIYWAVLGSLYARFKWSYLPAVLVAHSLGIISIAGYYAMRLTPGTDPIVPAHLVQRFTLPISPWATYVYEWLGYKASPDLFNTQAISVALMMMILIFSLSFIIKRVQGVQRTVRRF